jgi:hypothetical protein
MGVAAILAKPVDLPALVERVRLIVGPPRR